MKETSTDVDSQPESQSPISLARLISAVRIESHHAVALVQQLIDQLAPDRRSAPAGSIPPIEAIQLDPSGRLRVELAPAEEPFVRGLGRVLARLLESNSAPVSLRLLALQAASGSDAPMAFDDLAREIARWERPGRAAALSTLYAQACAVADGGPLPVAPARPVEEPPARPSDDVASPKPFVQPMRRNRRNRAIVYIAAAVLLFATAWVLDRAKPLLDKLFKGGLPPAWSGTSPALNEFELSK